MKTTLKLLSNDLKNISKEKLMLYPLFGAPAFIYFLGWFVKKLVVWLPDYNIPGLFPLFTAGGIIITPVIFSFVIGFVLIDEKESKVLQAIRITPLPWQTFLTYRISFAVVVSLFYGFLAIPLMNLSYIPVQYLIPLIILAALETPVYALVMGIWAKNKAEGMAFGKALGLLSELPMVAYFIKSPIKYAFVLLPSFYPVWAFVLLSQKNTLTGIIFLAVGFIYHVSLIWFLVHKFNKKIY